MSSSAVRRREAQIDHGLGGAFWIVGAWRLLAVVARENSLWPLELVDRCEFFLGLALMLIGAAALHRANKVWREESAEDEARLHAFLLGAASDLREQAEPDAVPCPEELEAWIRRRFEPCRERATFASHESRRTASMRQDELFTAEEALRAARAALLDADRSRARMQLDRAATHLVLAAEGETALSGGLAKVES